MTRSTGGVARFRYHFDSERRGSLSPNRRNVNLDFEKKKRLVDLGHGIVRRDQIFMGFAEVNFRMRYGAQ